MGCAFFVCVLLPCSCLLFLPTILLGFFSPRVRRAITFCQSRQPGVYCLVEILTNEGAGGLRHVLANDRNVHVPVVYGHAYLFRVSLNTHLQCCHKCPSAAQESKTGFEYCRKKKINWQRSKYVILSSERIDGQGWMDERKTQHACFLHLVTTVSVLSRPICPATQQQRVTLCI